ncbi:ABC-2 type transport system permease protein [Nonomuraea thailandensis]|uniref:ABC-2 type transport system permease protein n=1 Tax=Nonomuraea thailandensis TaxID=1188745 RepID=A0A9X2GMS9_9ACTN|nr:hypothetical protein [Nonomuraea thailandensis]MCP2358456.1 ABC-2 type transport system permease protein [Nonomuraea thailandensis]
MNGTWTLTKLVLRRERFIAPLWILLLAALAAGQVQRYATAIPDIAAFAREMAANQALTAFAGQVHSATLAGMAVWKNADAIYTILGLIMILTVIRHSRGEEESGRAELVGAGLGAVAAQLTQTARTAVGVAALGLGLSYVLRFLADGSGLTALTWLSPQGWSHLVRPYGDDNVAVLLLSLTFTTTAVALAYRLLTRRDLGHGLIPERPGPASSDRLRSPLSLAWRLQKGLLGGWIAGYAIAGLVLGALATSIEEVARQGAAVEEFFRRYTASPEATMTDAYLWLIVLSLGYVSALYPLLALLRLRNEETTGHAELLLSAPVSRLRWVTGHLLFALAGTVLILAAAGLTMGLVAGAPGKVLTGALVQAPATWILAGAGALAFGLLPRAAAAISWTAFLFVNLFGEVLGPILGIDYWIAKYAVPYPNLPMVISGEPFTATTVLIMAGITTALTATGLAAIRRRAVG